MCTSACIRAFCFSLLFLTIAVASAYSQDKGWRPISPEDLKAVSSPAEPNADAEALFWEVRIDDSSIDGLYLKHYVRVKIYTKKGREDFSKFDVPYASGTKIKDLEARSIKPDGTITEVAKTNIFEREIVKSGGFKVKAKSFAVPEIDPGVIVEYRYTEAIEDGGATGMRLTLQRDIPVRDLTYYYKPYNSKEPTFKLYNIADVKFVKDRDGYFVARRTNVPAFREEPRMPPADTVRPWMMLTGRSYAVSDSNYSRGLIEKDQRDWKKYWAGVSGQRSPLVEFMNKSSSTIKKKAEELTAGAATPDEKLRRIYEFCQTQIKNTSFDPTLTPDARDKLPKPESIADVLKRGSGSWFNIDRLYGALANAAGFETRLAYTGNRSQMLFTPEMADESLIHFAGVGIPSGDGYKVYSPGRPYLPFGSVTWDEEDTWGLFVGEKNFAWRLTSGKDARESAEKRSGKLQLLDDGTLEGIVRVELSGNLAANYRGANYDETETKRREDVRDEIKNRISTAEISDVSIENLSDNSKPIVKQFKIRVPGYAQKTGKRLFLQPGLFNYGTGTLFSSVTRAYDVYFSFPWSENDSYEIQLPKNFELENAETPAPLADAQKISALNIKISLDRAANTLVYNRSFYFGDGGRVLFPAKSYPALKGLFDGFYTVNTHTITLKQK